jgi:hypothetical protein
MRRPKKIQASPPSRSIKSRLHKPRCHLLSPIKPCKPLPSFPFTYPAVSTMKLVYLLSLLASVAAFAPRPVSRPITAALLSTKTDQEMPIVINGQNIDLTPSLVDYVNKRIGGPINKLASNGAVKDCDVVLCVSRNPKVSNTAKKAQTTVSIVCAACHSHFYGHFVCRSRTVIASRLSPA